MQQIDASPWRKFSLRLTALLIVAVVGGWAMSAVFASKPSTVGAATRSRCASGGRVMSPMELMIAPAATFPLTEYVEPF